MKKLFNLYTILGIVFTFAFILLIILLNIDKKVITISGKEVGLSHLNDIINYKKNNTLDIISDIILYSSFIIVILAIIIGLYELIKTKNLFKVNINIIMFGISLVISVVIWLAFDHVIKINYRPLNPKEVSFPSTHVFITSFILLSGHKLICVKTNNNLYKYISLVVAIVLIIIISLFRILSGNHYITDVCGGVFISLALYFLTFGISKYLSKEKQAD